MTSPQILPKIFYQSDDVVEIAKQLLGKCITTSVDGKITSGIIVETEAYRGPDDKGSHAYNGRYTERTKKMYNEGGISYVYICYGMHPMFNVVSGKEGNPHVVLIRAIEPLEGIEIMLERRKMNKPSVNLVNGPSKTAVSLGITKLLDGVNLTDRKSMIYLEDHNIKISTDKINAGPRVGMSIHVGKCAHWPWRFFIKDNKWVSNPWKVEYPKEWI